MLYDIAGELRKLGTALEQSARAIDTSCSGLMSAVSRTKPVWQDPRFDAIVARLMVAKETVSVALESLYSCSNAFIYKQLEWWEQWD